MKYQIGDALASRWTGATGGPAFFAHSTNSHIALKRAVITDLEATTAMRQAEVTAQRFEKSALTNGIFSRSVDENGLVRYRASKLDCEVCGLKPRRTPNMPARKILRSIHEGARDFARYP